MQPKETQKATVREDLARLRRVFGYLRPYKGRVIAGLATGALYGTVSGIFPKAVQWVFQRLFESGQDPSFWSVFAVGLAIPGYFAFRGLLGFLNTYCLAWASARMLRDIRAELFGHLQLLPMAYFVRHRVPNLIHRVFNNTTLMQNSLTALAGDIVKQPITIVVAIGVLAFINVWFCMFALALGGVCLIPMTLIGRKIRYASQEENKAGAAILGTLHESLSNVRVIKAYVLEKLQGEKFGGAVNHQMSRVTRFSRQRALLSPVIEWIGSIGIAAALLYVYFAKIPFSEFLAVVTGFLMMYEPLKKLGNTHLQVQRLQIVSENVFRLLDSDPQQPDRPGAIELAEFKDAIRYEGVGLRYVRKRAALTDIDLTIPCGTVCALIGPSGSGKTSLVNLLLRFYEPSEGKVRIDGHDLADVATPSLRRLIGLVTQETLLFADSVANNIALGKPQATRDEIVEAAKQAHAHEFIMKLPRQYDTVLSDRGQNLSGGQCQRIAIARAMLRDPAILVMDEATSALDAESEQQVRDATARLMSGRTVIVIAHRLSTVRHADQFVVLDEGRIAEIGGHQELMDRDGLYRRLYELQAV